MTSNAGKQGSHFAPDATSRTSHSCAQGDSAQVKLRHRSRSRIAGLTKAVTRPSATGSVTTTRRLSSRTAQATASVAVGGSQKALRRRSSKNSRIAILVISGVVGIVALGVFIASFLGSQGSHQSIPSGQMVEVAIPDGAGAPQIAAILKEKGVITDASEFYKEVKTQKADMKLKNGTYSLMTGANVSDLVKRLVAGPPASSTKLTVAEGLTVEKTAHIVEKALNISKADFMAQAQAKTYEGDYPFLREAKNNSLEGFLYPSTYEFAGKTINADTVIRAMLDRYKAFHASSDYSSARTAIKKTYGIDVSDYGILVLASIIEREAFTDTDRSLVSSVFYNRLQRGMKLQSDATMGFITGGKVNPEDLKKESPYNTYLNRGLTPTPICTPGSKSIEAALHPPSTSYLYFFIIEDGTRSEHAFSETLDEHNAAIARAKAKKN